MKIENIKIFNFRNYDNVEIFFSNNLNIFYGLNGSGKTNLVEAIYLLSLTKSFRIGKDSVLIKQGTDKSIIEGEVRKEENNTKYKVILNKEGKQVLINNNKVNRISDFVSQINIILYNPSDNNLISAAPTERRKLMNIEISGLYKEYLIILTKYNKILKQRNFYLKQMLINGNSSKDYLDILTNKLIEYGLVINKYRWEFVERINKYIEKIYSIIFGHGSLSIKYISDYNKKSTSELFKKYKANIKKELAIGKTLFGVHHDDLEFRLDNNLLKEYGSEGQRKNSIIAFKLAELNVVYEIKQNYPILILDDLFSALDEEKINNIFKLLNNQVQTFITTTEIDKIDSKYLKNSKIFKIINGTIEEETK